MEHFSKLSFYIFLSLSLAFGVLLLFSFSRDERRSEEDDRKHDDRSLSTNNLKERGLPPLPPTLETLSENGDRPSEKNRIAEPPNEPSPPVPKQPAPLEIPERHLQLVPARTAPPRGEIAPELPGDRIPPTLPSGGVTIAPPVPSVPPDIIEGPESVYFGEPQLFIRPSRYLQTGDLSINDYEDRPQSVPLDTIILHHTSVSKKLSIDKIAESWQGNPEPISGHFIIDSEGEVLLSVPVSKAAFHIRKQASYLDPDTGEIVNWLNHRSIGIEFHYKPPTEKPTQAQVRAGGQLLGALFETYPELDVRRIFGHGIQAFSQPLQAHSKVSTEPTFILMEPGTQLSENMILLLQAAAEISPRIAREAQRMGGIDVLAAYIRDRTLENRQVTLSIPTDWSVPSKLPVSPIDPNWVAIEVEEISKRTAPRQDSFPEP